MPTFKDKARLQRDKLRFQKEVVVEKALEEFLQRREKGVQDYEIRLCLESQGVDFEQEKMGVESDLENQLEENAPLQEREEGRLELWSQVLFLNSHEDQVNQWYEQAKKGEPLESLA